MPHDPPSTGRAAVRALPGASPSRSAIASAHRALPAFTAGAAPWR